MLLTLIAILAFEWFGFPLDGWRRIAAAVLFAAVGALAGGAVFRKFLRG